jgi:hypothetical protein
MKLRQTYISNLQKTMIIIGTNSTMIRIIITMINAWLHDVEPSLLSEIAPEASEYLKEAVEEQNSIGWEQWFCGRLSIKWGELYNEDIKIPNIFCTRPSSNRWGIKIIQETWKFIIDCWKIRNNKEHDIEGHPTLKRKEKICDKFLWMRNKGNIQNLNSPWIQSSREELLELLFG